MKKLTLILCFAAAINSAWAQYGQRIYYAPGKVQEKFMDGMYSTLNLSGGLPTYYATGGTDSNGTVIRSRFTRMSNVGANLANRQYQLFGGGSELNNYCRSIAEGPNRCLMAGAVMGNSTFPIAGGKDILILRSSATGGLASANHIDLNNGYEEATCIIPSAFAANKFYVCGNTHQANNTQAFVMKISNTGAAVTWVRYYPLLCATGLTGDTYATSVVEEPGTGNVFVVGYVSGSNTAGVCESAFISKFTVNGVHVYTFTYRAGTAASNNIRFQSIKPIAGSPGNYVIVGNNLTPSTAPFNGTFNHQPYLVTANLAGGAPVIGMSEFIPVSGLPGTIDDARATDVTSRVNFSSGALEYFVCGVDIINTVIEDGFVVKLNATGGVIATQFYGTAGADGLMAIEAVGTGANVNDGLTTFGYFTDLTQLFPPQTSYWVKPYYNLVSGCNESTRIANSFTVPFTAVNQFPPISNLKTIAPVPFAQSNVLRKTLCTFAAIGAGSNLKLAANSAIDIEMKIYPNPAQANQLVTVNFNAPATETAAIEIYDTKGVLMQSYNQTIEAGNNEVQLNNATLAKGLYLLRINSNAINAQKTFIVQ